MYRTLATLLLLVPLSLNGLWMLCAGGRTATSPSAVQVVPLVKTRHCKFICPTQPSPGAVCVLTAQGNGSIALFAIALAMPVQAAKWAYPRTSMHASWQPESIYSSPSLAAPNPPPEA